MILLRAKHKAPYQKRPVIRVCAEQCYNAKGTARQCSGEGTVCCCLCGGLNHGVGLDQARRNVKEIFAYQQAKLEVPTMEIVLHQAELFEDVT